MRLWEFPHAQRLCKMLASSRQSAWPRSVLLRSLFARYLVAWRVQNRGGSDGRWFSDWRVLRSCGRGDRVPVLADAQAMRATEYALGIVYTLTMLVWAIAVVFSPG